MFSAAALALLTAAPVSADLWSAGDLVTPGERREEIRVKESRLAAVMASRSLTGIVLTRVRNQEWVLGGSNARIVQSQAESPVWLLFGSGGRKYLVTDNIEASRLMAEEGLQALGWTERRYPWFAAVTSSRDPRARILDDVIGRGRIGSDGCVPGTEDVSADLSRARFPLTSIEMRRMRWVGARAAAAVGAVCRELTPGMRETAIGSLLAAKLGRDGITPTVVLIGSDERLQSFRHLVPTDAKVKRYVLVNLCAEKWGLVVAVSRLVHFGPVPVDLAARMQACAAVDAAYLRAARPGTTFGRILAEGAAAYAAAGWAEEWRNHHQGGSIGYFEREILIGPDSPETVVEGMALALNPTLPGVKCEDTVLVGPHGPEVLTKIEGWPVRRIVLDGAVWERPDILVRALPTGRP